MMPFSHHFGLSSALPGKGLRLNKITSFALASLRPGPPKAVREMKISRQGLFILRPSVLRRNAGDL
jgi:hypothetical protein